MPEKPDVLVVDWAKPSSGTTFVEQLPEVARRHLSAAVTQERRTAPAAALRKVGRVTADWMTVDDPEELLAWAVNATPRREWLEGADRYPRAALDSAIGALRWPEGRAELLPGVVGLTVGNLADAMGSATVRRVTRTTLPGSTAGLLGVELTEVFGGTKRVYTVEDGEEAVPIAVEPWHGRFDELGAAGPDLG